MAYIRVVPPSAADGHLAEVYREVSGARGSVGNILQVHSLHPEVMLGHLRLYAELMFAASPLTRLERELMAVAVSSTNGCHY